MKTTKPLPDLDTLRERLKYDPDTGVLAWLPRSPGSRFERTWNTRYAGKEAGVVDGTGYRRIQLDGRMVQAHRIAWALGTGAPPPLSMEIDHENLDKLDNRLSNLRLATRAENGRNGAGATHTRPDSLGLPRGVFRKGRRFQARVKANGHSRYLGLFRTIAEAESAVRAARERLHGEFAHHGPARRRGLEQLELPL